MADVPTSETPINPRAYEVCTQLQTEGWELWKKLQQAETILDSTDFYRTTASGLMDMAAVIAVDCGLTELQFIGMALKLYQERQKLAPKFSK